MICSTWGFVLGRRARAKSGLYPEKPREPTPEARDAALQDRLIAICREVSGIEIP